MEIIRREGLGKGNVSLWRGTVIYGPQIFSYTTLSFLFSFDILFVSLMPPASYWLSDWYYSQRVTAHEASFSAPL